MTLSLMSVKKAAALVGLPVATINQWVVAGAIQPIREGRGGRGGGHLLSLQQVFALGAVSCLRTSIGRRHVGPVFVRNIVSQAEKMPDEELELWLTDRPSPADEEVLAQRRAAAGLLPPVVEEPLHPADEARWVEWLEHVRGGLRRHLWGGGGVAAPARITTAEPVQPARTLSLVGTAGKAKRAEK